MSAKESLSESLPVLVRCEDFVLDALDSTLLVPRLRVPGFDVLFDLLDIVPYLGPFSQLFLRFDSFLSL
jgi:hypothetical protein